MGCQQSKNQNIQSIATLPERLENGVSNNLIEEKEASAEIVVPHVCAHHNFSMKQTDRILGKLFRLLNAKHQTTNNMFQDCKHLTKTDATSHSEDENEESIEEVVEEAVSSILCPICLDVYECPIMLSCGHSLCIYHTPHLKGKCPTCRKPFFDSCLESATNATLSEDIRKIVEMARMIDPQREILNRAALRLQKAPKPRDISVSVTKPTRETLLGLFLTRQGGKVYVSRIKPTSPFDETDLQSGFEVISINGTLCEKLSVHTCVTIVHQCVGKVTIVARRY